MIKRLRTPGARPAIARPASVSQESLADRPRVLIVDDDERNLLAVRTVLEDVADIVEAKSGEEALRHLLKGEFAVILLDVYMPGIDGYETAQIIRSREQTKRIPIVFLSAVNKENEHLLRGYAMGAVDYVFKPVDPIVLRSKVAVFVDLFEMRKEVQRKALHEQALLDENLRANEERLRIEKELRAAESELLQARKMDAIGKLTGGIAHDFNNLLAAVLGGIGLLERRLPMEEEHLKIIQMTRRAAEQGADLVKRLLTFARRQQLEPAPIEVAALSTAVTGLLAHTLGGLVELSWEVRDDVWRVFADQAQLELALMNLIINARDALPEGGRITVTVDNRVASEDGTGLAGGNYVVFCVEDEGCGIDPTLLEQVLEPFFTTKPVGKGTGLGLSMVYGFAQQSGGAFRMDSQIGIGTRAEIWLPRAGAELVGLRMTPALADAPGDVRPLRVLLIDDNEAVRTTTAALLEDLGHRVREANDGAEGLDIFAARPDDFDLIVTDYAMPLVSGTEVIRQAREIRAALPAVIITGYANGESIANRPEDVALLPKPFRLDQLQEALQALARQIDDESAPKPKAAASR